MTSVREVAEHAGVSIATVSRVFNGTAVVSEPLRRRVHDAADALGYTPSFAARSLRTQRTEVVGLVMPSLENPFFPAIVSAVNAIAHEFGCRVLVSATEDLAADAAALAKSRMVDGLLVVGPLRERGASDETGEAGSEWGVPVVAVDRDPHVESVPLVMVDNESGAREVVAHLLGEGHTRIAHVSGPLAVDAAAQRQAGYRGALADAGIPARAEYQVAGDFGEHSGYVGAQQLLALPERPTAAFFANDLMAIGGLRALRESGVAVPEEIAVVGFDGLELAQYVTPPLTTVEQPVDAIARRGFRLLMDQVNGAPWLDGTRELLPGRLVIRSSSRAYRRPGSGGSMLAIKSFSWL